MTASKGVFSFAGLALAVLMVALGAFAPGANASLDTVQGGNTKLFADPAATQTMSEDGIVAVPVAPGTIVTENQMAGVQLPITPGSSLESDSMFGNVDHTGGFSLQKPAENLAFEALNPQIVNGNQLWVEGNGAPSAPANDLTNVSFSKSSCTGIITYEADTELTAASALILNVELSTDVFTAGMKLAHAVSTIETVTNPPGSDRRVSGSNLLLVDGATKKMVAQSKDPAVSFGTGSADPVLNGGSVRLCSQGFDVSYPLPASGWSYTGKPAAPTGYRFKSKTGPITLVEVKKNKGLKVLGKGSGLGHTLATNPNPVDLVVATGDRRSCARYGGTTAFIPGKIFKAKKAPPPPAPPATCPLP